MQRKYPFQWSILIALPTLLAVSSHCGRADTLREAVTARDVIRAAAELKLNPSSVTTRTSDLSSQPPLLHVAALNSDLAMMTLLLERGADIEVTDKDGVSTLQTAAEFDRKESVNFLLAHGAKVDLNSAVMLDSLPLARRALAADPKAISARSHYNRTPLHWAARASFKDMAAFLLEKGADPDLQDVSGYTPLQETIWGGYVEIAQMLLAHHANPNLPDTTGRTPLHRVVYGVDPQHNREMAALLLDHGASLQVRDAGDCTPLFDGVRNPAIAALMLTKGADPNTVTTNGLTPLARALCIETMQILLAHGANMRFVAPNGWTALHSLSGSGDRSLVRFALAHGANSRARTLTGRTPLHIAAQQGNLEVVELLVRRGADVDAAENTARLLQSGSPNSSTFANQFPTQKPAGHSAFLTPIREAALNKHLEVVKYLQARGAHPDIFASILLGDSKTLALLLKQEPGNVNQLAQNRLTPLLLAVESGNETAVRLLLAAGADPRVRAPNLYVGGAAALAHYTHHETIATLIRDWPAQNSEKSIFP